jgi:hypothetical protein
MFICLMALALVTQSLGFQGTVMSVLDRSPVKGAFLRFADYWGDTLDCGTALFYDSATTDDSGKYVVSWPPSSNPVNNSDYKDFLVVHPDFLRLCTSSNYCGPDAIYLVPHKDSADVFFNGAVETVYGVIVQGSTLKLMTLDSTVLDSTTSGQDGWFLLRYRPGTYAQLMVVASKQGYNTYTEFVPAIPRARVWSFPVIFHPVSQPPPPPDHPATFSGVVKDSMSGQPLSGVQVRFESGKIPAAMPLYDSTVTTGADGRFLFTGMAPVTDLGFGYVLICKKDGFRIKVSTTPINLAPDGTKDTVVTLVKKYTVRVSVAGDGAAHNAIDDAGVVLYSRATRAPVYWQSTVAGICDFYDAGLDSFDVTASKYPFYPVVVTCQAGKSDTTQVMAVFSSPSQTYKKHTLTLAFNDANRSAGRMRAVTSVLASLYESKTLCLRGALTGDTEFCFNTIPDSITAGRLFLFGCRYDSLSIALSSDSTLAVCTCGGTIDLAIRNPAQAVGSRRNVFESRIARYEIFDMAGRKLGVSNSGAFGRPVSMLGRNGVYLLMGFNGYGKCVEKRRMVITNR